MPWRMAPFVAFPLLTAYVFSHHGIGVVLLRMLGFDEKAVRSLDRWTFPMTYFTFLPIFLVAGMEFTAVSFQGKDLAEVALFFLPFPIAASVFVTLVRMKKNG